MFPRRRGVSRIVVKVSDRSSASATIQTIYTGHFAEATPVLERSLREQKGQADVFDLFFLAMCHHRQGDAVKAKECLQRGKEWFQQHKGKVSANWIEELTAIQAEADSVLAQPPGQEKK